MGINKTELFTAGELAALFNISKQALLFYNRHNLLVPEYIAENGYRYYSLKQYFQLEIIVNLRKLDFSINDIKKYLEEKGLENLHIAITTQEKKCELEIRRLQNLKKTLQQADNVLDSIKSIQTSQISLGYQEEKYILISDDLDDDMLSKDRLMIMMQHNRRAYSKKDFKKRTTGWILNNKKFLDGKYYYTDRCFTEISKPVKNEYFKVKPAGLYLSINFPGTYYSKAERVAEQIKNLAAQNQLEIIGDLYILPLKNYWLASTYQDYLTQVSIEVKK